MDISCTITWCNVLLGSLNKSIFRNLLVNIHSKNTTILPKKKRSWVSFQAKEFRKEKKT